MSKSLQDCVDGVATGLREAESDLKTIMTTHMGSCSESQRKRMRNLNRQLVRIHCDLADIRDECFPDIVVQSGGT